MHGSTKRAASNGCELLHIRVCSDSKLNNPNLGRLRFRLRFRLRLTKKVELVRTSLNISEHSPKKHQVLYGSSCSLSCQKAFQKSNRDRYLATSHHLQVARFARATSPASSRPEPVQLTLDSAFLKFTKVYFDRKVNPKWSPIFAERLKPHLIL